VPQESPDPDSLSDANLIAEITNALLRVINRAQRDRPRRYGDGTSMTLVEAEICGHIMRRPGISAVELSEMLAVSRSAMSQTLTRLRGKGLVEEQPSPENRRRKQLTLTDAGERAVRATMKHYDLLAQEVYGEPRAELESYHRFIRKLEESQLKAAAALLDPEN